MLAAASGAVASSELVIGSKVFTESVILSEIGVQLARDSGETAKHRRELGGTRVLWSALERGDIDCYPGVQRHAARRDLRAAVHRRRCAVARRLDASSCVGIAAARLQQHLRARHAPRARATARDRANVAARRASAAAPGIQQRVPRARRRLARIARALPAYARRRARSQSRPRVSRARGWRVGRHRSVLDRRRDRAVRPHRTGRRCALFPGLRRVVRLPRRRRSPACARSSTVSPAASMPAR